MNYDVNSIYKILEKIFNGVDLNNVNDNGYVQVICPFHNDNTASAGLNPIDGFFQCFTCGDKFQFEQLLAKYFKQNNSAQLNKVVKAILNNDETLGELDRLHNNLLNNPTKIIKIQGLGISNEIINQLRLVDNGSTYEIAVPILLDGLLLGYKYYTSTPQDNKPKSFPTSGVPNGFIIPFDIWKQDNNPTIICEGEKDMLIARSMGFNAITLTGGANALPQGWEAHFKNRLIVIAYDNDDAGINGGKKLADFLFKNGCNQVKFLTNYHSVISNDKEDLWDFFMKYGKTAQDLAGFINSSPYWTQKDSKELKLKEIPLISLDKCLDPINLQQPRQSVVQIKAETSTPKSIPTHITLVWENQNKTDLTYYDYKLTKDNMHHIVGILNAKSGVEKYIKGIARDIAYNKRLYVTHGIKTYKGMKYSTDQQTIYTSLISPYVESEITTSKMSSENTNETLELLAYSFERLETSKIYTIEYKAIPTSLTDRSIVLTVSGIDRADNSISNFRITDTTKIILESFKANNIYDKVNELYKNVKYNGIAHLNFDLWLANELTFHSCLWFKLNGKFKRGTIYTNVIGDTRVGKSEISQHLVQQYSQGKFINAKLSTVDSLIGGTATKGYEQFIKAGVLPKNNKGLLVLEELHGLGNDYFKKVTEVKSSGKVSLQRVSGELTLECNLRLIEIANPRAKDINEGARSVANYTNGVSLIQNMIYNPEDIARNDIYVIIKKSPYINPYDHQVNIQLISKDYYQEKIKWVWSRKSNNFIFENEKYIWEQCKELNELFDCDGLTLLGAEAYIKVAKMSIALASMLASTLDYENVLIKNEHVDYIIAWLKQMYSNETMKVDEYVRDEKLYSTYDDNDIGILEDLYIDWAEALIYLETVNETTKDLLIQFSGKQLNQTGPLFSSLSLNRLVKIHGMGKVVPTIKFRKLIKSINRDRTQITQTIEEDF